MRTLNLLPGVCLIVVSATSAALAQSPDPIPQTAALAARVPALLDSAGIPGISFDRLARSARKKYTGAWICPGASGRSTYAPPLWM